MKLDELDFSGGGVGEDGRGLIRVVLGVVEVGVDLLDAETRERRKRALDRRISAASARERRISTVVTLLTSG